MSWSVEAPFLRDLLEELVRYPPLRSGKMLEASRQLVARQTDSAGQSLGDAGWAFAPWVVGQALSASGVVARQAYSCDPEAYDGHSLGMAGRYPVQFVAKP